MNLIFFFCRKVAIDKGGHPSWSEIECQKYTHGKPHPNAYEYFVAVDENKFAIKLVWSKDNSAKI